jgi:hypothetical protein
LSGAIRKPKRSDRDLRRVPPVARGTAIAVWRDMTSSDIRAARRFLPLLCFAATAVLACGGTQNGISGTAGGGAAGAGGGRGGAGGQAGTVGAAGASGQDGGQAGTGGMDACASATVGTACASEGMVCGSCSDPCQFCNTLRCQSGHWQTQEAAPAPCFDCAAPSLRCQLHSEYCKITTSHVGTTAGCVPLPAGCAPTASCACLSNPPLCSQTDAGAVTVTIQAP